MNIKKRSKIWVDQKLITKEQQQKILKQEDKRFLPFVLLSFLWLGVLCCCVGLFSVFYEYWDKIPIVFKNIGFAISSFLLLVLGYHAVQKRKKILLEIVLFLSFFMIGGGVGIFFQLFNFPITHFNGILIWALFSFILVFLAKREFLFLLWIPLFLGGVLGSLKLELLFLFFEQSPLFSIVLIECILFVIILLTKNFNTHFLRAIYKWSVLLYFIFLFISTREFSSLLEAIILFLFFSLLLFALSIKEKRVYLFNITSFFVLIRLVYLYIELFEDKYKAGVWFLFIGGFLLLFVLSWIFIETKILSKRENVLIKK